MRKMIKTAVMACAFAMAFQMQAFANFSWQIENTGSSYVGTTNVTVTTASGKTQTENAPVLKNNAVITFTETSASGNFSVTAYDGTGNPIKDFKTSLGTVKKDGSIQYTFNWNDRKSEGNSSYTGQAGVYEISCSDSDGNTYRQRFVINNVCSSKILSDTYLYSKGDLYQWKSNSKGWWVAKSDGSYLTNSWFQSPASGLWYYMGSDGYMATNTTTPDGYRVNESGVWVQ